MTANFHPISPHPTFISALIISTSELDIIKYFCFYRTQSVSHQCFWISKFNSRNPSKLKAAGKQCRAPPAVDPALGSWDCDFGDKSENTYGGGVSCRLKCNEGYAPVGMDKNVRPTKNSLISMISKNLVVF